MDGDPTWRLRTLAVHAAESPFYNQHGDIVPPIHMAVTFAKRRLGDVEKGYVYSRTANPTRERLEAKLAALESGDCGLALASGMAAITLVLLALLPSGGRIAALDDLYGGTRRIFSVFSNMYGAKISYVDASSIENLEAALAEGADLVWLESPSNPLLKIVDLQAAARLARRYGARVVVDNTFATPVFQRPLTLGADVVVHSATKYLSGHSDVLAGAIVARGRELCNKLKFLQNAAGPVLPPFDSWLLIRSIKTLPLRMKAHEENAKAVAKFLESHPKVKSVYYPGLPSHRGHEVATRQMSGYGGMVSFEVRGGLASAVRLVESLRIFKLAESLGGVESLVEIPALMTHAQIPREDRLRLGISDGLIRLSVGIEDPEDLVGDLEAALKSL